MSYPVTAHLGVPHGLACALFLPGVLAFNAEADDGRLAGLAGRLGVGGASDLALVLIDLYRDLGVTEALGARIPDLGAVRALAGEMVTPGRADANMRPVDGAAIGRVLDHTAAWLGNSR
jgi:alcohol dehydrogenase